ncbi:Uncharacterized protein OS=Blastopirellula marina DSM 3645 GN=DSM3645_10462 PE=4 SV=1 [Gemmata massiliana]|uniref:Lipoprotein n=1 Tax=Gemmata massiliana TaxID=1210884 RepID=A0A6P2CQ76_9BACT|nr:hypothetical protein [Gemmata massiliana]VTR91091.1 Uncharacterized protein OS=Blastopirellula marina DSM 3645 GN=DSM3645_10462 PE=4 SV=1 [Gemmata massiliana]
MNVLCRLVTAAALFAAAVSVTGCGNKPKLAPVTGKVVHKNQPLTAGSVWFVADTGNEYKGEKPSCQLQVDGSFTMRSYPHGDGVPPGVYKVTLSPELANRIGRPNYADAAKTPLSITVPDEGVKDHTFEVK